MSSTSALRSNSPLRRYLGPAGVDFLEWSTGAFGRLLPHADLQQWQEIDWAPTQSVWTSSQRTAMRGTIGIGERAHRSPRAIQSTVRRRNAPVAADRKRRILDTREHDICRRIAFRISDVLRTAHESSHVASIRAIRNAFDEQIIAERIRAQHGFELGGRDVLGA